MFIKGLRQLLDEPKYRYPLICAFLQKRPRDISGALQVLQLDKKDSAAPEYSSDASLAEDLMDFLLLLVKDSVLVFREALGLYDLSLAALVVERASDLDPAYYGALLQRLNDSCPEKRKYLVDLELGNDKNIFTSDRVEFIVIGNMESALRHLFAFSTFPSAGDMVIDFAVEHRLFPLACSLFAEYPELLTRIRCAYADDLSQQGQHLEAACFYALIKQEESAREEYKRACMWQLVVYFCRIQQWKHLSSSDKVEKVSTQVSQDGLRIDQELVREIESLVEYLKLNGKAKEAAFLIVDYLNDPQRAIEELIAIEEWLDAISVLGRVPLKEFWGVVETTWKPALKNAAQEHCEEWKEIANKMGYYCQRLEQVRLEKKNKSETKNDAVLDVYVEEEMLSESDASSQSVSR